MVTIEVTPAARDQVLKIMEKQGKPGAALRLYVEGGGCSGLTYGMSFDKQETGERGRLPGPGPRSRRGQGQRAAPRGRQGRLPPRARSVRFKIYNPNASHTCSCGKSFSA